jgi:hypothetical protein
MRRLVPLVAALVAGLALPTVAEEEHSIPEPIAPPVAGALYDGFARIVSSGDTISAFHTDHMGRFTTTLQLSPGVYLFFPDCRGGVACENLRFTDVTVAHLSPAGKAEPAQALQHPFKSLTIDTSGLPGLTIVRFTGRVEANIEGTPPATIKVGLIGHGFILIPGVAAAPPPGKSNGGDHDSPSSGKSPGGGTTGNY